MPCGRGAVILGAFVACGGEGNEVCDRVLTEPYASYSTGGGTVSLAVGDLNGDHAIDAVVVRPGADAISVLYGIPGGGFAAGTDIFNGHAPRAVSVADLNGDQIDDVVTANRYSVTVLLGAPAGPLMTIEHYPSGVYDGGVLQLADLNADARPDIILGTLSPGDPAFAIFLNEGNGTFGLPRVYSLRDPDLRWPVAFAFMHTDPGETLDLVVSNGLTFTSYVGSGHGTFGPGGGGGYGGILGRGASADLDHDGRVDVAWAMENRVLIVSSRTCDSVGCSSSANAFDVAPRYSPRDGTDYVVDLALVDIVGDDELDLVATDTFVGPFDGVGTAGTVHVLPGNGDGTFAPGTSYGIGAGIDRMAVRDVDGDDALDVVVHDERAGAIHVLQQKCLP